MSWQDRAFGGELAGMALAASGDYSVGGGWEVYLAPGEPDRAPRLRTWPAHPGYGGSVSLGHFGSTAGVGVWGATGWSRDRCRAHRAFAVSAVGGTTRVVITDTGGDVLELLHAATHPDGCTQLFVGASTTLAPPAQVEAFDADGGLRARAGLTSHGG